MPDKAMEQESKLLSPLDAGEMLGLSPIMIRKLVQDGQLNCIENPAGLKRFSREEIKRYACDNDLTLIQPVDEFTRILVIDDDEVMASYLIELLLAQKRKIKAQYAVNSEESHSKIKTFNPHIILLDIMMPELDGFDICSLLKLSPLTRGIRIIALTGACTDENIKTIMNSGAESCLPKPVDSNKLMDAIGL